ncbi:response regulator [Rhodanobacter spathiphylli]|uniref:histidine kinase n=1 Tax=Rhodanobacter spathiphylli B39 TaxID=1163407 RepID=I4W1K4_9GAMM|nr:response regulator [Rhodanobacter spathiphylli]EIL93345.1 signal transduction histidine kinase [Rhodanobacter spathiphylli B39]
MATHNSQQPGYRRKISWLANQPLTRKMMLAIGLLLGVFLVANVVTLHSLQTQESNRRWAGHTYQALLQIDTVQRAAQTAQVGARGFLLTGSDNELALFRKSTRELDLRIRGLRQLVADNPLQQGRLDAVAAMAGRWQRQVVDLGITPLQRLDPGAPDAALERQRIQAGYIAGRTVRVEEISAVLDQMADEESRLLALRNQQLDLTLRNTKALNALSILLGILLGITVIRLTSQLVIRPLRRLTDQMTQLSHHNHDFEIRRLDRRDEVGEIARALQVFKQMSLDTAARSWIRSRVADISQVLLQATTHKDFAQWLTSEVVPLCNAGLGLFYSFDDARHRLDLLGSYGLRLSNRSADQYMPGEGLVGQCAVDRKAIILDQVPADYLHIDSGSGEAVPTHLAILPVIYRETLIGVLELASFAALTALQRQLLDELLPIVALALENLNQAVHTQDLLQQTQEQADELRLSELVMRQQKEVLHESNATLQAKTAELEEQSKRLIASEEEQRVQAEELRSSNEELRDMTDSLNRQKVVLEELQQETAEKAAELARASQYKSEFLANMSHELRTPLNSLLILSRSLADNDTGNLDDEQIESAQIIHDAGNSLLHLINDILDLSKVEAGKMELMVEEVSLAELGRRLQRNFTHVASNKQLGFEMTIDPGLPDVIATDGGKVEQIANNLLSNAFKFTASGAVTLHIGRPQADLEMPAALSGQPLLAITVSDTGIGIPPDKLERIFNAFEQVDASTSRQFGGTGLGLAISRKMAQLLGGDVVLRSDAGRGSQFTLLLPETPPATTAPVVETEAAHATQARRIAPPALLPAAIEDDRQSLLPGQVTILVIEDDPAFVRILIDLIHRRGYRALAALDGESGLQLAREHHPSGILLDVSLPVMDGWTVLDRLKVDEATRSIPVHFVSVSDVGRRGMERGAVGFLTKPVSREAIAEALDRLLRFGEGKRRRLLVVEDDAASRKAIRTALRGHHVELDEADSAEDALPKIAEVSYDCIVLDLGLPGMSGLELMEHLSDRPEAMPPVVVYSGRELDPAEQLKLRRYADAIVLKGARSSERLLQEVGAFLQDIPRPAATPATTEAAPTATLAGHRVLLVDDDMRNLFALSKVLRGWGLQVEMAQDGYKALAALQTGERPDLILMDIMMPGMDGYTTIRNIRDMADFTTLPIIAVTAKAMTGDRELCLQMGANDYLSKPIDIDKLAIMLRHWLTSEPS